VSTKGGKTVRGQLSVVSCFVLPEFERSIFSLTLTEHKQLTTDYGQRTAFLL
jgi:hypothetical protein